MNELLPLLGEQEVKNYSTLFNSPSFKQGLNEAVDTLGTQMFGPPRHEGGMAKKRGRPKKQTLPQGKAKVQKCHCPTPGTPHEQCMRDARCTNMKKHRGKCSIPADAKEVAGPSTHPGDSLDVPVELESFSD